MTQVELQMIPVTVIHKSPYQHRKEFTESKLDELARSIERDGLIEPIVVRRNADGYELIAGERRWRATKRTSSTEILARIVQVNDLQARRMCAAENLQRQDLSSVEEVFAITELIDAEMIDDDTYAICAETPVDRVKWLLTGLWSDNRHNTNYFAYKFISKINQIFESLPRLVEWQSFYNNDFRTITTVDDDVKDIAIKNQLNKSQTKALDALKKQAPEKFKSLVSASDSDGKVLIRPEPIPFDDTIYEDEPLTLRDLSAKEISAKRWDDQPITVLREAEAREIQLGEYDGDEWYTPPEFIEAARTLLGQIDLDPASCDIAQRTVQADDYYTKMDNGLALDWEGRVWCNPPYSMTLIKQFTEKAIQEYEAKRMTEGLLLVNNCTDAGWFIALAERFPVMFSKGRAKFWQEDQRTFATRQGQAIFYLGTNVSRFHECFKDLAYAPLGRCA